MSSRVVAQSARTRNTPVWIDVYEWLLFDFLELERLDFVRYLQFFKDDDDLALACQQPAMHRNQRCLRCYLPGVRPRSWRFIMQSASVRRLSQGSMFLVHHLRAIQTRIGSVILVL